jgi:predicted NACHT family NTPase
MAKRSLQASELGIQDAKRAFALKGWTQENLAGEVNLKTRQPIWRFLSGQPVERHVFLEICSVLGLAWRTIAMNPPADFPEAPENSQSTSVDLEALVQKVRSQRSAKIQDQCGILQLLDISRPCQH